MGNVIRQAVERFKSGHTDTGVWFVKHRESPARDVLILQRLMDELEGKEK